MKSFQALIALTCIANVNAHLMMVCSATSCNTPGRVTIFLGSYHNNPNNAQSRNPGGELKITTLGGDEYAFSFSATCGMGTSLNGQSTFAQVLAGMKNPNMPNSCMSQGETSPAAGGKNIIDADSVVTCYKNDGTQTDFGTQVAVEDIENPFCRYDGGDYTQGNKVKRFYGFYYMVLDNVVSGDYTFDGWTDEIILSTYNRNRQIRNTVDNSYRFVGVCALIGNTATHATLGRSTPQAISLSVASQSCDAGRGARCNGAPRPDVFPGIDTSTVAKCNKADGALPGYMCNARCLPGHIQFGSMVCDSEGNWASFGCWADPSYVDPSTVIVIEGDSSTPSLQVDSDATSLLSTTVDPIPVATTDAPCHMSLMGQHIHPIANFKSIQYDAAQMCGYVSMHGAVCDFTCQDSVRTGGKLTCNNGVWVKDESNPPQCLEIADVPRGAVAAPTLTEDPNNEDGFIIHWERPLTCQGSTPTFVDGVETTVHVCSPAHGYRFVVKNLLNNGDVGGDAPLQCDPFNSGAPSAVYCSFAPGQVVEASIVIGVVAINGAGESSWSRATMSAYEFGWVDASEDPCWVNLGAQEVFTTVTHGEGADVETFTHSLGFVGPHMRAHTDYYGKDWVKFWSSDRQTRLETRSPQACCHACRDYDKCDYWTYVGPTSGCYLKHQDDRTVYTVVEGSLGDDDTTNDYAMTRVSSFASPDDHNLETHRKWHELTAWNPSKWGTRRRLLTTSPNPDYPDDAFTNTHGNSVEQAQHTRFLLGVDFAGDDWVKFVSGDVGSSRWRSEADSPTACAEACSAMPGCCYWTWSPIDIEDSCYLKNSVPMQSKVGGLGQAVHSFSVVSGVNRCGWGEHGGVGENAPVIYPVTLFRRQFTKFVPMSSNLPSRPAFYMIGSGITMAYITSLPVESDDLGQLCHFKNWIANPCFTHEEISAAIVQFNAEVALWKEGETDNNGEDYASQVADFQAKGGLYHFDAAAVVTPTVHACFDTPNKRACLFAVKYNNNCNADAREFPGDCADTTRYCADKACSGELLCEDTGGAFDCSVQDAQFNAAMEPLPVCLCSSYARTRSATDAQHKIDSDGKCWSTDEPAYKEGRETGLTLCCNQNCPPTSTLAPVVIAPVVVAPVVWASIAGYCGAAANGGDWSKPGEVTVDGFAFDDYRPGDVTEAQCKAGCEAEADCTGYSLSPGRVQGHHDCYLCSKTFTSENENTLKQYQDYTTFKRPTVSGGSAAVVAPVRIVNPGDVVPGAWSSEMGGCNSYTCPGAGGAHDAMECCCSYCRNPCTSFGSPRDTPIECNACTPRADGGSAQCASGEVGYQE